MAVSFKQALQNSQAVASPVMTLSLDMNEGIAAYDGDMWSECSSEYLIYSEYIDNNVSQIDEQKNIHIHPAQINLAQESNAQYIVFDMPRRYDGFDLNKTRLWIHFVNSRNENGYDEPINVRYSDDKIRFGWLIDERVTAIAGSLQFELHASGRNSHGDKYEWISRTNRELTVHPSLCGDGVFMPEFPPEMNMIVTDDGDGNVFLEVGVVGNPEAQSEE